MGGGGVKSVWSGLDCVVWGLLEKAEMKWKWIQTQVRPFPPPHFPFEPSFLRVANHNTDR